MNAVAIMPDRPMDGFQSEPLPPEMQAKLKEPLPPEAITSNDKHSHLSSIKPAFVIERMNEVFGIGGYIERYREIAMTTKEVVYKQGTPQERKAILFVATVHGTLDIPKYGIHLENYGGSENESAGDELKGACTDSFTKMCSHLGIGLEIYKGKHDKQALSDLPPCPECGKTLRKSSKEEGQIYCWKVKGGCGWNGTIDGLKAVMASKNGQSKPAPADKITIHGTVTNRELIEGTLWLKVGERRCAAMEEGLRTALKQAWRGSEVELLVSERKGQTVTFYQIHKVIGVKAPAKNEQDELPSIQRRF